jgi:hypothetical protein
MGKKSFSIHNFAPIFVAISFLAHKLYDKIRITTNKCFLAIMLSP